MAEYLCVELSGVDSSALPGQDSLTGHGVIVRRGDKQAFAIPYAGHEFSPLIEQADQRCRNVMSSGGKASAFLNNITNDRGIGGYTSISDQFKINATGFGDLVAQLRERGFRITQEV